MSALSIQPTYPIFTDIDGQPLEAGYVWLGAANLDPQVNPINVYWDAALTIPAPQPIRTLGGYPSNNGTPARLYVNSDYSIRVMNRNGSVVYSAPEATEIYSEAVIGQINSTQVNFLAAGTGAIPISAQTQMRESTVSVTSFGAVGDGITPNDTAFALALASGASFVSIPAGTFVFNNTIVKPDGVALVGQGSNVTIISAKHNGNIIEIGSGVPGASLTGDGYRSLQLLSVTNYTGYNSAIGIRVVNITNPYFKNVQVIDGPVVGIRMQATLNGVFNEVMTRNCSDIGLYMQSTTLANGNYRNVFSNCHSYYDRIGIVLDMYNSFENYFNSCAVEGSLEYPIEISNTLKLVFNMLYLEGNGTTLPGGKASIKLRGGDSISFYDCIEISNIPLFEAAPVATNVWVQNFFNANNNNQITQWPGLMNLQQGKIQFPSVAVPSSQPNTLDDYEEGTWVPTDLSGAGLVFSTGVCRYTKIGRIVTANFNFAYPVTANGAATIVAGLPFLNKGFAAVNIGYTTVSSLLRGLTADDELYWLWYKADGSRPINSELSGATIRGTIVYGTDA